MSNYLDALSHAHKISIENEVIEKAKKRDTELQEHATELTADQLRRYEEVMKEEHWLFPLPVTKKLPRMSQELCALATADLPPLPFSFADYCQELATFLSLKHPDARLTLFGGALRYILSGVPYTDRDICYMLPVNFDAHGLVKELRSLTSTFLIKSLVKEWTQSRNCFSAEAQSILVKYIEPYVKEESDQSTFLHDLIYLRYAHQFNPINTKHGDPIIVSFDFQGIDLTGTHIYPWSENEPPQRQHRAITDTFRCNIALNSNTMPTYYCIDKGKRCDTDAAQYALTMLKQMHYKIENPKEVTNLLSAISKNQLVGYNIDFHLIKEALLQLQATYPSTHSLNGFTAKFLASQKKHYSIRRGVPDKIYSTFLPDNLGIQLDLLQTLLYLQHMGDSQYVPYAKSLAEAWQKNYGSTCSDEVFVHFVRLVSIMPEKMENLLQVLFVIYLHRAKENTEIEFIPPSENAFLALWKLKMSSKDISIGDKTYRGRSYFLQQPWPTEFLCKSFVTNIDLLSSACKGNEYTSHVTFLKKEVDAQTLKRKLFLYAMVQSISEATRAHDDTMRKLFASLQEATRKEANGENILTTATELLFSLSIEEAEKKWKDNLLWKKTLCEGITNLISKFGSSENRKHFPCLLALIKAANSKLLLSNKQQELAFQSLITKRGKWLTNDIEERKLTLLLSDIESFLNTPSLSKEMQEQIGILFHKVFKFASFSSNSKICRDACRLFLKISKKRDDHPYFYEHISLQGQENVLTIIQTCSEEFLGESSQAFYTFLEMYPLSSPSEEKAQGLYRYFFPSLVAMKNPKAWQIASAITLHLYTMRAFPVDLIPYLKELAEKIESAASLPDEHSEANQKTLSNTTSKLLSLCYRTSKGKEGFRKCWQEMISFLSGEHVISKLQNHLAIFSQEITKSAAGNKDLEQLAKQLSGIIKDDISQNLINTLSQIVRLTTKIDVKLAEELFNALEKQELASLNDLLYIIKATITNTSLSNTYHLYERWKKQIDCNTTRSTATSEEYEIISHLISCGAFPVGHRSQMAQHILQTSMQQPITDNDIWEQLCKQMVLAIAKTPSMDMLQHAEQLWHHIATNHWISQDNIHHTAIAIIESYRIACQLEGPERGEKEIKSLLSNLYKLQANVKLKQQTVGAICRLAQQLLSHSRAYNQTLGHSLFQELLSSEIFTKEVYHEEIETTCQRWVKMLPLMWKRVKASCNDKRAFLENMSKGNLFIAMPYDTASRKQLYNLLCQEKDPQFIEWLQNFFFMSNDDNAKKLLESIENGIDETSLKDFWNALQLHENRNVTLLYLTKFLVERGDKKHLPLLESFLSPSTPLENMLLTKQEVSLISLRLLTFLGTLYSKSQEVEIQKSCWNIFKEHFTRLNIKISLNDRPPADEIYHSMQVLKCIKKPTLLNLGKVQNLITKMEKDPVGITLHVLPIFLRQSQENVEDGYHCILESILTHIIKKKWVDRKNIVSIISMLRTALEGEKTTSRLCFVQQISMLISGVDCICDEAKEKLYGLLFDIFHYSPMGKSSAIRFYEAFNRHLFAEDREKINKIFVQEITFFAEQVNKLTTQGKFCNDRATCTELLGEAEWNIQLYALHNDAPRLKEGREIFLKLCHAALDTDPCYYEYVPYLLKAARAIHLFKKEPNNEGKTNKRQGKTVNDPIKNIERLLQDRIMELLKSGQEIQWTQRQLYAYLHTINVKDEKAISAYTQFICHIGSQILYTSINDLAVGNSEVFLKSIDETIEYTALSDSALSHFVLYGVMPVLWQLLIFPIFSKIITESIYFKRSQDNIDEGFAKSFYSISQGSETMATILSLIKDNDQYNIGVTCQHELVTKFLLFFPKFIEQLNTKDIQQLVSSECRHRMRQNAIKILSILQKIGSRCNDDVFALLISYHAALSQYLVIESTANAISTTVSNSELYYNCLDLTLKQNLTPDRFNAVINSVVIPYFHRHWFWPDFIPQIIDHVVEIYKNNNTASWTFSKQMRLFLKESAGIKFVDELFNKNELDSFEKNLLSPFPKVLSYLGTDDIRTLCIEADTEYQMLKNKSFSCQMLNLLRHEIQSLHQESQSTNRVFFLHQRQGINAVHSLLVNKNQNECTAYYNTLKQTLSPGMPLLKLYKFIEKVVKPYLLFLSMYPVFLEEMRTKALVDSHTAKFPFDFFASIATSKGANPREVMLLKMVVTAMEKLTPSQLSKALDLDILPIINQINKILAFFMDKAKVFANDGEFPPLQTSRYQRMVENSIKYLQNSTFDRMLFLHNINCDSKWVDEVIIHL